MNDKGILNWFGRRKGSSVNDGSRSHAMAVLDTVTELRRALDAMAKGDRDGAVKCTDRLFLSEEEADRIEDRLAVEISRGEMSVQEREDLVTFVRKTDKIANWAKEGAIHLQLIIETRADVPKEIWEELERMVGELMEEIRFLVAAIESMQRDANGALRNIDALNDQERIIDSLYFAGVKHSHLSVMDPKTVLLVDNLFNAVEMAADNGKSCGDTINILIVSRGVEGSRWRGCSARTGCAGL
ncbi:DUF47 family protein [Methanomassiliicoccaceae archaeon COG_1]|nr:DUF47 family protein [Methanomassiliicoccaceae archaeon COG_1]